jgi:DNA-directed RNA polymerase specialized sigma24 family protein
MEPNEALVPEADDPRLSQLATRWTLLARAHAADPTAAEAARDEFLPQYCTPIYRYLLGVAGDPDRAEELTQEFALRFVRGDFRQARPDRGRFRDYVKAALRNLVAEWDRRRPPEGTLPPDSRLLVRAPSPERDDDVAFTEAWRKELLNRTWAGLERESAERGQLLYAALRSKADDPNRTAAAIGAMLMDRNGRPVTADAARQLLHRAREKFAALLRAEVAATLPVGGEAAVDAESANLGLLVYCRI